MYKGGIPRRSYVIEVSLLILCVVFPGEMKATAVTLGRVLPTLLNLTFSPFEFNHLLCSSQTGNHVEIHPTPNKCKYPQAVTHTCTVCLILTGMHPYVLRQLLQVAMPHGQILCHHSCTGCLNGGCYSQWPNSQWLRSPRLMSWSNFKLDDVLQTQWMCSGCTINQLKPLEKKPRLDSKSKTLVLVCYFLNWFSFKTARWLSEFCGHSLCWAVSVDVDVSLFISESMWTFSQDFKKLLLRHLARNKKPLAFSSRVINTPHHI